MPLLSSVQSQACTFALTLEERFWSNVEKTDTCWIWNGPKRVRGYGGFFISGRHILAHRFSYELVKGKIPDGKELHHICGNHACVNPDHLEPVTHRENVLKGDAPLALNARKTHCPKGHPLIEGNLNLWQLNVHGSRTCLTCYNDSQKLRSSQRSEWIRANKTKTDGWTIYNKENGHVASVQWRTKDGAELILSHLEKKYPGFKDLLGLCYRERSIITTRIFNRF